MASTFSTNLKIELMATGENAGTWGNITNTNLGTAIEQALVGYGAVSFAADANLTITLTNSNSAQAARALVLNVTSALSLSTTRELIVPTFQKQYIVQNNTTGGQSITVKTSAGTGITVPNGRKAHLYVDGTDVIHMFDFVDINGGTIDGVTIGGGTAGAGSFTTLSATGNVTLGDASTDTVTVNGYMGVGGAANSAYALNVTSSALTGVGQWGIRSVPVATSASTSFVVGVGGTAGTAAASFTVGDVYNIYAGNSAKGAGSTITNQHGVYIADQTQGTNNYGITSLVSSGSNKWNIYASGTARNHMAGALSVGATTDPGTGGLYVAGNTTLGDASTDTVTVNGYMGIGGAPNSTFALNVLSTLTSGVNQRGIRVNITGNDTSTIAGISTSVATAASAFTVGNVSGVFLNDATKGAGSTITSQYGVYVSDQTQGTNNYGITSLVSSGSNKWNIYASGTATNYFAGLTQYGVLGTPSSPIHILQSNAASSNANGITIEQSSTGDAQMHFLLTGAARWTMGIDNSDSDSFKIGTNQDLGTSNVLTLTTGGAASFTGNVTLGDASTDTVTVNGYMGVGGAPSSSTAVVARSTALTSTTQTGVYSNITGTSGATSNILGFYSGLATAAAAFTAANVTGFRVDDATKGAGSTITNQYGLLVNDLTQGTNNFGVASVISSGANKWNIYANGTANNAFVGNVRIGSTTAPTNALDVTGSMTVSNNTTLGDASTDTVTVNGYMGIGGAPASANALRITSSGLVGTSQIGMIVDATAASDATVSYQCLFLRPRTAAASFTVGTVLGINIADAVKGAGNTITNQFGISIADQTQGTSNFGIGVAVSSGTGKWNIYANGTASNYFAGQLQLNSTTLSSIGANSAIDVSNITSGTNASWRGLSMSTVDLGASTGNVGVYLSAPYASGTVNQAFFRVKRGAGSVYNGAEIAFNGAFRFLGSTVEDASERMRIDASGNVGIGTTTITERLHVEGRVSAGASSDRIVLGSSPLSLPTSDGNAYISWGSSSVYGGTNGDLVLVPRTSAAASVRFYTGSGTPAERMRIDASGNVSFGATAPTWNTAGNIVLANTRSIASIGSAISLIANGYYDATDSRWEYTSTAAATWYNQSAGQHIWYNAASGTANTALTWTQAMTLNASGDLALGTSSPLTRLHVQGTGTSTGVTLTLANGGDIGALNDPLGVINFYSNDSSVSASGVKSSLGVYNERNGNWDGNTANHITYMSFATCTNSVSTEKMRITSAGFVGIQTTAPATNLHVVGTIRSAAGTGGLLQLEDTDVADASTPFWVLQSDTSTFRVFSANRSGTGTTGSVERLRIDASGNVGIGTTSPSQRLHVVSTIRVGDSSAENNALQLSSTSTTSTIETRYATPLILGTNATERLRIDASGNLGIGTTSPAARLHVEKDGADIARFGDDFGNNVALTIENASGIAKIRYDQASDGAANKALAFFAGTNERMRIDSAGNVKIGGTADRATTAGTNQLVLFNGTAPVGTLSNGVSFYSAAGEARVMDAAGNSTLLSPHDQATNEWIFHSKHTPTGKVLRIDVERLLRFVNDHFGLDAVQEFIEN